MYTKEDTKYMIVHIQRSILTDNTFDTFNNIKIILAKNLKETAYDATTWSKRKTM